MHHLAAAAAKSLQSCPTLCNPIDGSPPGLKTLKIEVPYDTCVVPFLGCCVCVCALACSVLFDSLQPHGLEPVRLLCPWDFPGRMGCHFLLQGIFLTQGLNPSLLCLLHWQADSLPQCHYLFGAKCCHMAFNKFISCNNLLRQILVLMTFLKGFFFLIWTIFKVFIEFVTILLLFYFWVF